MESFDTFGNSRGSSNAAALVVERAHRDHFGKDRKTGARGMGGALRLYTARRLKKDPVTVSR